MAKAPAHFHPPTDDRPFSLPDAWAWAKDSMGWTASLYGDPVDILERTTITTHWRNHFIRWFKSIEMLVRRLILIEALSRANPGPPQPNTRTKYPRRRLTRRRTTFRLFAPSRPNTRNPKPNAANQSQPQDILLPSAPTAHRFDALVRLLRNPEPAIRRLARKLWSCKLQILALSRRKLRLHAPVAAGAYLFQAQAALPAQIDRFLALLNSS